MCIIVSVIRPAWCVVYTKIDMAPRYILLLLLAVAAVHAAEEPLADGLKNDADNSLWQRMISSLSILADEDLAYATIFAPTDAAVNAFLYEMGLTFDELLARPVLVDQILSYHLVPGATIKNFYVKIDGNKNLISSNPDEPSVLVTGDANAVINAFQSPMTGLITLVDAQGNNAVVVGSSTSYDNIQFYDISAVLMSASYFYNFNDAMRMYPQWSGAAELFGKAALYSETLASTLVGKAESTFLIPNNDALEPVAKALVSAPAADLAQVLQYHMIAGLKAVPKDWQNGASVETKLPGHKIKSVLTTTQVPDVYSDETVTAPLLKLVPEVGLSAQVTVFNIFTGKSIILALNEPLLPNTAAARAIAGGASPSGSGRHLLQRHRSSRSHSNNWSAANTQRAIRAAARGDMPVSYATRAGVRNAGRANCVNCNRWSHVW